MPPFLVRLLGGDKLILASLQSNSFGVIFLLSLASLGVQHYDVAVEDDDFHSVFQHWLHPMYLFSTGEKSKPEL